MPNPMNTGHKEYEKVPDLRPGDTDDLWAIGKARDQRIREHAVMTTEIKMLHDRLKWCYFYNAVNYQEDCLILTQEYLRLIKEYDRKNLSNIQRSYPDFEPAKQPIPKPPPPHPQ
eukprot:CAMPEP_0185847040 /NCGR_PEP_ID=MMETSP1354-20130828/2456_1 /TAXON_ID=708628 /ORGANISM="Erythrolobus madagascarensis, Strain CCMP3276" /LENGTH=114 /DNA_ID=CAMNT_0028547283 /DNA_START=98 /DNA_END=442 /DNA_ORIENTATION=+